MMAITIISSMSVKPFLGRVMMIVLPSLKFRLPFAVTDRFNPQVHALVRHARPPFHVVSADS
jgi:hypothetical protein